MSHLTNRMNQLQERYLATGAKKATPKSRKVLNTLSFVRMRYNCMNTSKPSPSPALFSDSFAQLSSRSQSQDLETVLMSTAEARLENHVPASNFFGKIPEITSR